MTDNNEQQAAGQQQAVQGQFGIQRIYMRDMSFESPMSVMERSAGQSKPKIDQEINTKVNKINDEIFEVVLQLTVTVKLPTESEEKVAFLAEVHQAGLFQLKGIPEAHVQRLLLASCPNILFPYARESVDSMAIKGGFPPVSLPHINFDQLYLEQVARQQAQQQGEAVSPEKLN